MWRYGARGVQVCDRWRNSLRTFLADVGPIPKGLQIDRIDGNLGYHPGNVRFVTPVENCRNRRNSTFVELNGERHRLADLCERLNIARDGVHKRLALGWTVERAISVPGLRPYSKERFGTPGSRHRRGDGVRRCGACNAAGHNRRTCRAFISPAPPSQDTPPPLGIPSDAEPVATTDAQPLSNSRANAQPRETTSAAAHSHSANVRQVGNCERHSVADRSAS